MKRTLFAAILLASLPALAGDLLPEARKVASALPPKLLAVLTAEMEKSGPEGAIAVCRDKSPQMARTASEESGWAIRRVSLNNRNPKAVPDAWERAVLEDFDRRAAAGENPAAPSRPGSRSERAGPQMTSRSHRPNWYTTRREAPGLVGAARCGQGGLR